MRLVLARDAHLEAVPVVVPLGHQRPFLGLAAQRASEASETRRAHAHVAQHCAAEAVRDQTATTGAGNRQPATAGSARSSTRSSSAGNPRGRRHCHSYPKHLLFPACTSLGAVSTLLLLAVVVVHVANEEVLVLAAVHADAAQSLRPRATELVRRLSQCGLLLCGASLGAAAEAIAVLRPRSHLQRQKDHSFTRPHHTMPPSPWAQ